MSYSSSPGYTNRPPGDNKDDRSDSIFTQKPKRTVYLIPIPIGLILFLIISIFRHFTQPEKALNTFDSESAYNSYQSGNFAFFSGDYDRAIVHYNMAIISDSEVSDVYNGRGLAYQAKGDHGRALEDFDRALELKPDSAMVYNNRALSHTTLGEYANAIADLDKALELQPNFGKAYYNQGLTYQAMGDYDRAIESLSQAIEFSSDTPSNWRTLPTDNPGRDMMIGMDNQLRAMQSQADLSSVFHIRGLIYLATGEFDSAISDLNQAIELEPNMSIAYYARAMAYLNGGNITEAETDCQILLGRCDDPEIQNLTDEIQVLCNTVSMGLESPPPTSTALPTKTAENIPVEEPAEKIAIYVPQAQETPITPKWEHNQASCEGKPYNMWSEPGTYLYQRDDGTFLTLTIESGEAIPSLGVSVPDTLSMVGTVPLTTEFGAFNATLLSAGREYKITDSHDYFEGTCERSELYVCGYGLIKLISSDVGIKNPGNYAYDNRENLVLVSFTPLTTNEAHVRYILADIQLGNIADEYRTQITDEETAEALRRWDGGIRVVNIEEFERKVVDGQWQIVYAIAEKQVIGTDIILNSDSTR